MSEFTRALLAWFDVAARPLPWRENKDPYRVWLSEIMLQQTQVATVVPYFERWLTRFPTLAALASAEPDEVLKAWEGLGYYRRARLLHQAARKVLQDHGGALPLSYEGLLELPGVGPYTAAATAAIAFNACVLAVDGNVRRVAARLFCLTDTRDKAVSERLSPQLPADRAGDFNEALMELGATVCTPRSPRCSACPLRRFCCAFKTARVANYPRPKPRKAVPTKRYFAYVCQRGDALLLVQREPEGLLGGLWGFILSETALAGLGLEPVLHAYTHFKVHVTPVITQELPQQGTWVRHSALNDLALSTLDKKILSSLGPFPQEPT